MRILVDECVPAPIQRQFTNHACSTVQVRGWGGIKNGDLLQLAEGEFDVFITSDQNIRYQHVAEYSEASSQRWWIANRPKGA